MKNICVNLRSSAVCFSKSDHKNHREHRGHRENWQPSALSVYSVVDFLSKYSIFQNKLKSFIEE
jgi:hypothetical protein